MFGGSGSGLWGSLAPPTESLLEKPRAPPARPIPLNFPNHVPKAVPRPLSRQSMRHLRRAILNARRPTDNSDAILDLMNVHLHPNVPLDSPDFVPADFLPERPFLYDADLEAMLAELSIENEDAFREVLRQKPREGRPKPRVAYSRNFYGSLEDIRRYCDASSDNYYEVEEDGDKTESSESKKPPSGNASKDLDAEGDSNMTDSTAPSDDKPTASTNPASDSADASDSNNTTKKTKEMYTGLRLGNSTQLPPGTRTGAMRNLLKMVMHKFTCRDYDVSSRERLRIRDVNIPPQMVMYNFIVARLPADRALARARHVEGPLLGVSVRHETVFDEELHRKLLEDEGRDRNEVGECLGAKVDLLREVGSALVVALQRNREGKKREDEQERVTASWWWAKEKRWGGGETRWGMLANEVFEEEDPSWSPTERELQLAKREKTQEEMRKVDEAVGKVEGNMRVEDLLAKSETQAQQPSNSATIGLLSESSVRIPTLTPTAPGPPTTTSTSNSGPIEADETSPTSPTANNSATGSGSSNPSTSSIVPDRPPKKKHRLTLADRVPQHALSPQEREDKRERDMNERAEFREGRRLMYTAPMRRKWFREWTNVRPNSVAWDEKVIWKGIGRPGVGVPVEATAAAEAGSIDEKGKGIEKDGNDGGAAQEKERDAGKSNNRWDEVFELSCVNHHVSLVKVRVSTRYLNWLENGDPNEVSKPILGRTTRPFQQKNTGSAPGATAANIPQDDAQQQQNQTQQVPVGEDEDILQVWRSPYYDLFDMAQRKEFFVALWRVMCWLCRGEVPVAEWERVGTLRKAKEEEKMKRKEEEGKAEAGEGGNEGEGAKEVEMKETGKE